MTATAAPPQTWAFEAIGVPWTIETPAPLGDGARSAVTARIAEFDAVWSRFRDDSIVSRAARHPGSWRLPAEAGPLLDLYRRLYDATGGRVSPLVGRALESLGYDAGYRLTPAGRPAPVPAWTDAISWDGTELHLLTPALLDVGAAGKGLLVDLVGATLAEAEHPDAVVDASGDLRVFGTGAGAGAGRVERVALEHPLDPELAIGVVDLPTGAICGSATNRRAWAGAHHVLDALTGLPTAGIIATWAIAEQAMVADGAATALFFVPGDRLRAALETPLAGWVRMSADGRVEASDDFPGELFA